jgi:hypothetical protein
MGLIVKQGFSGPEGASWTEIYHADSGTPFNKVTDTLLHSTSRTNWLASNCTLEYVEASDLLDPNNGYRQYCRLPGRFDIKQKPGVVAEVADTVIYKFFNASNQYRFCYFRGCGDFSFERDARGNQQTPPIDGLIKIWFQACLQLGFGWYKVTPVDKLPGQVYSWNPMQFVTAVASPGFAQVGLSNPITLQASSQVYLSLQDKKLLPGLNGIWSAALVGNAPSKVIQIRYQVAENADITQPQGRCRVYQTTFTAFANFPAASPLFNGFGRRKTKDFTHRGRDTAQRIRTLE